MGDEARPALEIVGLDHVVLRVVDLDAAVRFYVDVLGGVMERQLVDVGLHQVRLGAHLIDLVPIDSALGRAGGEAAGETGRNVDHFALELAYFDEDALRAHLVARGVEPGEVATRYGARGNGPSMYLRDPDGNTVELKGVVQPRAT